MMGTITRLTITIPQQGIKIMQFITQAIVIGVAATLAIDMWAVILRTAFNLPTTNWGMVGRWFAYLPRGQFMHRPIGSSKPIKYEHLIGWLAHYAVGIGYAYCYLILVFYVLKDQPSLISAISYGVFTLIAPWLVLQPALGLGLFAKRAESPSTVRAINISIHLIFGAVLYFAWQASLTLAATS
tara:strand:- start:6189 stop:6740 length:552 start_codon:yes stop_codon:yes gene_type:complete